MAQFYTFFLFSFCFLLTKVNCILNVTNFANTHTLNLTNISASLLADNGQTVYISFKNGSTFTINKYSISAGVLTYVNKYVDPNNSVNADRLFIYNTFLIAYQTNGISFNAFYLSNYSYYGNYIMNETISQFYHAASKGIILYININGQLKYILESNFLASNAKVIINSNMSMYPMMSISPDQNYVALASGSNQYVYIYSLANYSVVTTFIFPFYATQYSLSGMIWRSSQILVLFSQYNCIIYQVSISTGTYNATTATLVPTCSNTSYQTMSLINLVYIVATDQIVGAATYVYNEPYQAFFSYSLSTLQVTFFANVTFLYPTSYYNEADNNLLFSNSNSTGLYLGSIVPNCQSPYIYDNSIYQCVIINNASSSTNNGSYSSNGTNTTSISNNTNVTNTASPSNATANSTNTVNATNITNSTGSLNTTNQTYVAQNSTNSTSLLNSTSSSNITNTTNQTFSTTQNTTNSTGIVNSTSFSNNTNSTGNLNTTNQTYLGIQNTTNSNNITNSTNINQYNINSLSGSSLSDFIIFVNNTLRSQSLFYLNTVPGGRKYLQPIFTFFVNFDDLWLYVYHQREYDIPVTYVFISVQQLQSQKWNALPMHTIWQFLGLQSNNTINQFSSKQSRTSYKFYDIQQNANGFILNTLTFLCSNVFIMLIMFLIFHILFYLLFNYRISIVFRNYSFWLYLLIVILQGNVQYLTYLFSFELQNFFSIDYINKFGLAFAVILYFGLFIFSLTAYPFVKYYHGKFVRYFAQNLKLSEVTSFYMAMQMGYRNILLGFLHSILDQHYFIKIGSLMTVQIIFLSFTLTWISKNMVFQNHLKVWVNIFATALRILVIFTFFFDYQNIYSCIQDVHIQIFYIYISEMFIAISIQCIRLVIDFKNFIFKQKRPNKINGVNMNKSRIQLKPSQNVDDKSKKNNNILQIHFFNQNGLIFNSKFDQIEKLQQCLKREQNQQDQQIVQKDNNQKLTQKATKILMKKKYKMKTKLKNTNHYPKANLMILS